MDSHGINHMHGLTNIQKQLRLTIFAPCSLYSSRVIHIAWNWSNEDRIEPPIQADTRLSGGAVTFTFTDSATFFCTSSCSLSFMNVNIVVPPAMMMFPNKSLRTSPS